MSKRYWFIIAAFGLICFPASGEAQEETGDEQGQATQQEQPAQSYPLPFPIEIIENQSASDSRKRREEEAHQNQIDDLVAQQGMNEATRSMNNATQEMRDYAYVQTWLVGIGTVLLVITLCLTLKANRAAQAAVDVTRDIGMAQVRAYVHLNDIVASTEGEAVRLHIKWENTGQSPARRSRFGIDASSDTSHGRAEFPIDFRQDYITTIAAGRKTEDVSILLDGDHGSLVKGAGVLIWGAVEYDDVFVGTKRHRTEFCVEVGGVTASKNDVSRDISTYECHNGADEDCMFKPST